jgi:hypothetical protein
MKDWTKEMFKISEDISNDIKITYKTISKYIIVEESANILKRTVLFFK